MGLVASQHSRHSVSQETEAAMQAELRDSLVLELGGCDCPLLFFESLYVMRWAAAG